jgi:GxxExxY protein
MHLRLVMDSSATPAFLNEVTGRIIEAAIEIHRALGPGLLETAYLACLVYELTSAGLRFERERAVPLTYKEVRLNCAYRVDLVVEACVLVEVKALGSIADIHVRQLMTYLRLADFRVGLLLNFGASSMKEGIHRRVNRFPDE